MSQSYNDNRQSHDRCLAAGQAILGEIKEGCTLTTDELAKIFKKQVAFCEKIANKDGELIHDRNVQYSEEIKAK